MKFSLIVAATVALNNAFVASASSFSKYTIVTDMTNVGNLVSLDPFKLDLFFEKATDSLPVTTELYTGVNATGDDCSKGTLVPSSQYRYNVSKGIKSPKAFLQTGPNTDIYTGAYEIINTTCVAGARQGFMISEGGKVQYVAYIDTHVTVNVTTLGDFANFSADVAINKTAVGSLDTDIVKKVGVKADLCALAQNDYLKAPTTYKIGQMYSICVEPDDSNYMVSSCVNVTCKTPHYSRDLFVDGTATMLSSNLPKGRTYYDTSGGLVSSNHGGFSSPVFSGYFTKNATKFSCSGVVALTFMEGRRLELQRFEFGSNDLNRHLQEEGREGSFDTEIQLDDRNADLLTAGTSMVSILGTVGLVGLSTLMASMM